MWTRIPHKKLDIPAGDRSLIRDLISEKWKTQIDGGIYSFKHKND